MESNRSNLDVQTTIGNVKNLKRHYTNLQQPHVKELIDELNEKTKQIKGLVLIFFQR